MSGQQKTHLEQKSKNKHIPFQNHYEKIQTIIQIFRLCNYQFTHYSAHQVNVFLYSYRYNASHQMEDRKKKTFALFCNCYFFIHFLHSTPPPPPPPPPMESVVDEVRSCGLTIGSGQDKREWRVNIMNRQNTRRPQSWLDHFTTEGWRVNCPTGTTHKQSGGVSNAPRTQHGRRVICGASKQM